jgi:hypothetical protein
METFEKFVPLAIVQPTKLSGKVGTDRNGNDVNVGSLVKASGSSIVRKVIASQDRLGRGQVSAVRVDGINVSFAKYVDLASLEVVA